jgi:DNA-binding NtrC family response regulator
MTLENTFITTSEITESAAPPAWDAMPEAMPDAMSHAMPDAASGAMPDAMPRALQVDGADDDADDPRCADTGPAHEPRAERQAVVIDEFDPTLSFRDAKERAIGLWERWYVAELLRHTRGNLSEAARVAHSDRSHLRKLVRKHLRSAITRP